MRMSNREIEKLMKGERLNYKDKHQTGTKPGRAGGTVRIISGAFKGRKLPVIDSEGLRPTTDRVKETVFNWLMFKINGARCLDMFSGSGSLGFEAASRGASETILLEKSHEVAMNLKRNVELLKCENISVYETDALVWLKKYQGAKFDVIFLDPPFRKGFLEKVFELLPNVATQGSLVYVEQELEETTTPPQGYVLQKEGTAGQVTYRLYEIQSLSF